MKRGITLPALAAVGFGLLYLPIVVMIVYSFNASKLASVWGGWSVKWYGELLQNEQILQAVNDKGDIFVSHTKLRGRYVIRVAISNLRTDEERVDLAWSQIQGEAERLRGL